MRVKLHATDVGVPNCWFNINRMHASIHDLISALRQEFDLPEIQLEMDGFLLLENGATVDLLRENDLIYILPKSRKRLKTLQANQNDIKDQDMKESVALVPKVSNAAPSSSSSSSSETSSAEDSDTDARKESESDDSSESGETSSGTEETATLKKTVPPVMTSFMDPPMSLVGKNKRKILPKMLDQERVHVHFDDQVDQTIEKVDDQVDQTIEKVDDNVVFSTVRLYDDEPQKDVLSAAQKRRIRRKKAAIYKTLESLSGDNDEQSNTVDDQVTQISKNGFEKYPNISSISEIRKGMKVAYQILAMSKSYQPEISSFREAVVIMVDTMNKVITLQNIGMQQEININQEDDQVPLRKFELPPDDEYAPEATQGELILIHFNDLISIKKLE